MHATTIPIDRDVIPGVHRVSMPMPVRTEPVNCWVLEDASGAWVVDTGLNLDEGAAWQRVLAELQIPPDGVAGIVITHFHPDHVGAAAPLAEFTGAPVYASALTIEQFPGVWGAAAPAYNERLSHHLIRHGMPVDRALHREWYADFLDRVVPHVAMEEVPAALHVGGRTWRVVHTPGHADGHICLHDALDDVLIAGDHLLERISPTVGKFPDHAADPLGAYLASLERIASMNISRVLPGHGTPFAGASDRCEQLLEHHADRVRACVQAVESGGVALSTTWEIARTVFGPRLDPANERFAVSETLAHLEYATRAGAVRIENPGNAPVRWSSSRL